MDHYFYRMTTKITNAEIKSFMCDDGKRRTGMSFFSTPWADEDGISMDPKLFMLQCSTFSEGTYIGGAANKPSSLLNVKNANSVNLVTHYYFD